jgi:hypothetical protein
LFSFFQALDLAGQHYHHHHFLPSSSSGGCEFLLPPPALYTLPRQSAIRNSANLTGNTTAEGRGEGGGGESGPASQCSFGGSRYTGQPSSPPQSTNEKKIRLKKLKGGAKNGGGSKAESAV